MPSKYIPFNAESSQDESQLSFGVNARRRSSRGKKIVIGATFSADKENGDNKVTSSRTSSERMTAKATPEVQKPPLGDCSSDEDLERPYTQAIGDPAHAGLSESKHKEPLRPGDVIFYHHPNYVAGCPESKRQTQVLATNPDLDIPLELDNGEMLLGEMEIVRVQEYRKGELLHHRGIFRPIEEFRMRKRRFQGTPIATTYQEKVKEVINEKVTFDRCTEQSSSSEDEGPSELHVMTSKIREQLDAMNEEDTKMTALRASVFDSSDSEPDDAPRIRTKKPRWYTAKQPSPFNHSTPSDDDDEDIISSEKYRLRRPEPKLKQRLRPRKKPMKSDFSTSTDDSTPNKSANKEKPRPKLVMRQQSSPLKPSNSSETVGTGSAKSVASPKGGRATRKQGNLSSSKKSKATRRSSTSSTKKNRRSRNSILHDSSSSESEMEALSRGILKTKKEAPSKKSMTGKKSTRRVAVSSRHQNDAPAPFAVSKRNSSTKKPPTSKPAKKQTSKKRTRSPTKASTSTAIFDDFSEEIPSAVGLRKKNHFKKRPMPTSDCDSIDGGLDNKIATPRKKRRMSSVPEAAIHSSSSSVKSSQSSTHIGTSQICSTGDSLSVPPPRRVVHECTESIEESLSTPPSSQKSMNLRSSMRLALERSSKDSW